MEARRGKALSTRSSAASRTAAVGKENVCPDLSSRNTFSASRSPLPDGFPRAPLQDITDVLSPVNNIRPNDADDDNVDVANLGLCRRGKKRSKCVSEIQTLGCCTRSQTGPTHPQEWRGLRKCVTLQAASTEVRVEGEPKAVEDLGMHRISKETDPSDLKDAAKPTDSAEVEWVSQPCSKIIVTGRVLETETEVASSLRKPLTALPKGPVKHNSSLLAMRLNSRALQEKPKMSSIMKFR